MVEVRRGLKLLMHAVGLESNTTFSGLSRVLYAKIPKRASAFLRLLEVYIQEE